jgi:hypothetical protein
MKLEDYLRIRGKLLAYEFKSKDELLQAIQYIKLIENTFNNLASRVRNSLSYTISVLYPLIGYRGIKRMFQKFAKQRGWELGIYRRRVVLAHDVNDFMLQLIYSYPKKM